MRVLALALISTGCLVWSAGCREVTARLPAYDPRALADGPAAAVALLPGGAVLAGAGDRLWIAEIGGATASLAQDYGSGRARLQDVSAMAGAADGRVAIADARGNRVWLAARQGTTVALKVLAGTGTTFYPIGDGGQAFAAQIAGPRGVAWLPDGSLAVSDTGHGRVRRVGTDGRISTLAGTGLPGPPGDGGPAARAYLAAPGALAAGPDGSLLVAETGERRIRRIAPDGTATLFAALPAAGLAVTPAGVALVAVGTGIRALAPGTEAEVAANLHGPSGLATGPDGTVAVADTDRVVLLLPRVRD